MINLPSGTVTFLFTDIEGSTKLAQQYSDEMPLLLARHHEILNQAIEARNGSVFQIVGDSFSAAFHSANDALNAALDAQRLLHNESWLPAPIKVRMGLHTGFAERHENGYRGYLTLARVQRVMSCGHGGQILLSLDITEQVREQLPQDAGLRDLGWHHLKSISQAEHLFQLVTDDLPANFPPLKSTPVGPSMRKEVFTLLDHIVRGQLIGRESEMSELEGFWNRAERGQGHLVLLSGEPGVGKTRLVEELTALAQLRGALVLEGHFHPELGVTYLGLREALQDFLRSLPTEQARAAIGSTAPELVKLVPEVEAMVGNITPNPPMGELSAERLRLFDHVTQFLIRLTKKTPMLFVLEDLHWADGPSLLFLHFLLRNTRQVPILVLGTYRETELDPVRPFYETLLGLNRDRLYTRVALHGLDAKNVERLVSVLLDGPVVASLVSAIRRDTEGNPFFIEEVIKGLVEGSGLHQEGGAWRLPEEVEHFIPQSIQIALGKRLETLSDDARAALSLASVLGREFDMDVLLSMSEWDEDRMLDALDEAVKAQLITELRVHGKETYRFAHALLAQVIYDAINTRRRARFHQQAGESLERVYARKLEEQVETLAYHFSRASSNAADKAVTYGLRAAEKAVAVYAHDQAIRYYTEVLEALHDLDEPQSEARAWELMGDAKMRLYYVKEAIAAYEKALTVLERGAPTDAQEQCRLSFKLGELIIKEQKDPVRARQYLEQALTSSAAPANSPQRVKCMAAMAICLVEEGRLNEAFEQAQSALELAEGLANADGIASACGAMCSVHEARGDLMSYAQVSERQVAALDQCNDFRGIFEAYTHQEYINIIHGNYERAKQVDLAGLELCKKFNAPGWEIRMLTGYIWMLGKQGLWAEALEHGKRVLLLADRVGCDMCFSYIYMALAGIEAKLGHRERSIQHIESSLAIISQLPQSPIQTIRWCFFRHVFLEEWKEAWAVVEEARAMAYPDIGTTPFARFNWSLMLPEVAARASQLPEAERLARETLAFFERQGSPLGMASSHFALGLAHTIQDQWDAALTEFKQALEGYRTLGHPWDAANTRYEMGLVHAARGNEGDKDTARQLLDEALATFSALGAAPGIQKVAMASEKLA
jgi:predicted ATPase/class 3 adenylate cyclase